jgi:hypothetical protein
MTLEEGIFSFLNQHPALTGLNFATGAFFDGTNCRIYPGQIDENAAMPALSFTSVGGPRSMTMSGPESIGRARIQFTAASLVYSEAVVLIGALIGTPGSKGALDGFTGQLPNGVVVQLARPLTEPIDTYFAEARLYARHVDVEFVYEK